MKRLLKTTIQTSQCFHALLFAFVFSFFIQPLVYAADTITQTASQSSLSADEIKALKNNLCADPKLNTPQDTAKETEGGVCASCLQQDKEKLKDVAKEALDKLKEQEQIVREIEFFKNYTYKRTPPPNPTAGSNREMILQAQEELAWVTQEQNKQKPSSIEFKNYGDVINRQKRTIKRLTEQMYKLEQKEASEPQKQNPEITDWDAEKKKLKEAEAPYLDYREWISCNLSFAEALSIVQYTGSNFADINASLRLGPESAKNYGPQIQTLNAALDKLKNYEGYARRGVNLPPSALEKHQVGTIVDYRGYTSASAAKGFDATHRFVIKSKTGKYIAPYSALTNEEEVLFKPGTRFKILSRENVGQQIHFVMEEVDP